MTALEIIVISASALIVTGVIFSAVRKKKRSGGCGCGCASCHKRCGKTDELRRKKN